MRFGFLCTVYCKPHGKRKTRESRKEKFFSCGGGVGNALFAIAPQCCFYGYTVPRLRRSVLASCISLALPQAAGLVHSAARPLQTANAALVCCLVPFLSCQKACRGGRPVRPPRRKRGAPFRIHRKCCFLQRRCNCAFGDHIFSLLREKIWKKRTPGTK